MRGKKVVKRRSIAKVNNKDRDTETKIKLDNEVKNLYEEVYGNILESMIP